MFAKLKSAAMNSAPQQTKSVAMQSEPQETARPARAQSRQCSKGYVTTAAISHFLDMHPEVPREEAHNLQANLDTTQPLYFWQLYSLLGTDRIVKIVQNLYASIAADKEEPWLPNAFTRISDWDHHVATQAGFWLDAMGRGKFYHGGEYRVEFHHHHNAGHVMTQVGAARWMHHMRHALDISDLGTDPRVKACIDEFVRTRMEKYAASHDFETGDRVYKPWNADEWVRTTSWRQRGPEPKQCPVTGQFGDCVARVRQTSEQSTSSGSSSPQASLKDTADEQTTTTI